MATRFRPRSGRRGELSALALLLLVALVARLVQLEEIEPNVLGDEADHVSTMYRIFARGEPGPFDLSWDGNPAFSLYPALPFLQLFGMDHVGLRVCVAVTGVLMLAAFYLVSRRHCSPLAGLAATGLLAFSHWALFFSRNGEVNVFVALYALLAVWCVQRALDGKSWWPWALAGFWCGMGWYGFLAGVLILPCLLAPLLLQLLWRRGEGTRLLFGLGLMLAVFALTVAPRLPALWLRWDDVERYVEGRSVLKNVPPAEAPGILAAQVGRTLRAYLLFDPSLEGNSIYLPPGRAPLDGFNATLFLGGLIVSVWSLSAPALWVSLLVIPLAATQVPTTIIPDLARAILALPAHFLFVGLAIDRLLRVAPFRPLAQAAVLVLVPAVGWANWQTYADWMKSPQAAAARQPALDYDELDGWQDAQWARVGAGEPGLTVTEWRADHPRAARTGPGGRARGRPDSGGVAPQPLGPITTSPLFSLELGRGPRAPRGLTTLAGGDLYVVDQAGQLGRLAAGPSLEPLGRSGPERAQAWDVAAGPDGFLYVADAEQGVILKLAPSGELVATLGTGWGLYRPRGLDVGVDGRIYVADTGRNRIVIASTDGAQLGAIGPTTSRGELEQPTDVAIDATGRVYVALPERARLSVLDEAGQELGGWAIAKGDTLESPRVALTPTGAVVVSEPSERRVRLFDQDGRQLGQIESGLTSPFGVAATLDRLYVGDPAVGRLLAFAIEPR